MLLLLLVALCSVTFAHGAPMADCKPDTTDLVWRECMPNPSFKISNVSVTPYPIDPSQPPNLVAFTYTILNGVTYDSFLADLEVSWFGKLVTCGWHKIPIPLKDLPGCDVLDPSVGCPMVGDGQGHWTKTVDLAKVVKVIEALHKNTYHQLTIHVKDNDKVEQGCLQAEFMVI